MLKKKQLLLHFIDDPFIPRVQNVGRFLVTYSSQFKTIAEDGTSSISMNKYAWSCTDQITL